jgi:Kef-type K+ transport system membrane component KefB
MRLKEKELFLFIIIILIMAAFLSSQSNRVSIPVIIGSAIGGMLSIVAYDAYIKDWLLTDDV